MAQLQLLSPVTPNNSFPTARDRAASMPSLVGNRRVEAKPVALTVERPSSASAKDLQAALMASGLQQYWRRLEEMGYTRLRQILKLGRGDRLDELIGQLRPLPGHTVRLLNFIEEERARSQVEARAPAPLPISEGL